MERPALIGGPPAFPQPLPRPNSTGPREIEAALAVLRSGVLSDFVGAPGPAFLGGAEVRALESAWTRAFGVGYAVSVNSATSGLHAALVAAGVRPGDEVIVPPQTMSATATAVVMAGASPVFVDALAATACLDPAAVEAALSPRTRAIIVVNLFGGAAPVLALRALCDSRGLTLIEDNAQAPGGRQGERWLGTIGHLGVFSLNFHKTIQCGEGGVVVTDDERLAWRLRLVRNHGENVVDDFEEDSDIVGYNYRLTEVQAAIARVQLARLEELTAPRIAAARALDQQLAAFPALRTARPVPGERHVYYVYPIWLDPALAGLSRDRFVAALAAEGCPVAGGYVRPLYHLPLMRRLIAQGRAAVRGPGGSCPNAERAHHETLLYTTLVGAPDAPALVERFAYAVAKVLHHAHALEAVAA
jgi:perosamine synthetase